MLRGRQYLSTCSDGYSPSIPITPECRQGLLELELSENVEERKGKYIKKKGATENKICRRDERLEGERYKIKR